MRGRDRLTELEQKHLDHACHENVTNLPYAGVVARAKASKQAIEAYFEAMKHWTVPLDTVTEIGKQQTLNKNVKESYVHIDRYLRHVQTVGTSVTVSSRKAKKDWGNKRAYLSVLFAANGVPPCVARLFSHCIQCFYEPPADIGLVDNVSLDREFVGGVASAVTADDFKLPCLFRLEKRRGGKKPTAYHLQFAEMIASFGGQVATKLEWLSVKLKEFNESSDETIDDHITSVIMTAKATDCKTIVLASDSDVPFKIAGDPYPDFLQFGSYVEHCDMSIGVFF